MSKAVRKFLGVVLCAVMVLTALPLPSFAGAVDHKTAADPVAALAQIEAMQLPDMPQELAAELRGGAILSLAWGVALGLRIGLNQVANYFGWNVRFTWLAPLNAWSY